MERVQALIEYGEMNMSEISYLLGYSSVHYLSNQFKKITGFTCSEYKRKFGGQRKYFEDI